MAVWTKTEKVIMAGALLSGSFMRLTLPTTVPTIPIGSFLEILDEQRCSITVVNMQYARVRTTEGGLLLPSATYHVMLGRSIDDTVHYSNRMAKKICKDGEVGLQFEQSSLVGEAFQNSCSLASGIWLALNQFILEKYAI